MLTEVVPVEDPLNREATGFRGEIGEAPSEVIVETAKIEFHVLRVPAIRKMHGLFLYARFGRDQETFAFLEETSVLGFRDAGTPSPKRSERACGRTAVSAVRAEVTDDVEGGGLERLSFRRWWLRFHTGFQRAAQRGCGSAAWAKASLLTVAPSAPAA